MINHERTIIAINPAATGADRVEREVITPLLEKGISYDTFVTPSPNYDDNVEAFSEVIRSGDLLVVAGGDGTVAQATEAIVRSGVEDVRVAALPFGGFADLAPKRAGILDVAGPNAAVEEYQRYLMSIHLDGEAEPWRYANAYFGIGRLAILASSFDTPKSRDRLRGRTGLAKRTLQVAQLGNQYFKQDFFVPEHRVGQPSLVGQAVTDYLFVNNDRAGGIMHFPKNFGHTDHFGVVQRDVSKIARNIPFGLMALGGHAPSVEHPGYDIEFIETSSIPVHNEGEFAWLDVDRISIRKDPSARYAAIRPSRN